MALSPISEATANAAILSALSNVIAQWITSVKTNVQLDINWVPVLQFVLLAIFQTPPNYLWQQFLESTFPAYLPEPHPKKSDEKPAPKKLSKRNTMIKVLLDQTLGAAFNTLLFCMFSRSIQAAMSGAPVINSIFQCVTYWSKPGAINFSQVDAGQVWAQSLEDLWPLMLDGWKFWPVVSLFNYTVIQSIQTRNLVGSMAGVVWGVYMSLVAAR